MYFTTEQKRNMTGNPMNAGFITGIKLILLMNLTGSDFLNISKRRTNA